MSEDEKEHLQREKEADEARKTEFNVGLVRHHHSFPGTHTDAHVSWSRPGEVDVGGCVSILKPPVCLVPCARLL